MRMALHEKGLLLLLSVLSLLPPILIGFSPEPPQDDSSRGVVIAPAYMAICILGVTAALYPSTCSRPLNSLRNRKDIVRAYQGLPNSLSGPRMLLSHHPPCGPFRAHEFSLAGRSFCVGCTGMTVGATASSMLVVLYFSRNWDLSGIAKGILGMGVFLVALELTQTLLLDTGRRVARFLLNALFVVGVSLILVGEDRLRRSLPIDLYVLVLALLWLYIRIRSSQLSHRRTCSKCDLICPLDEPVSSGGR